MPGRSVLLVGGTSHVGKSTAARAAAAALGWRYQSTDRLARHPGRPWTTDLAEVHEHYATLPVDELAAAQLRHYERMWPAIEALVLGPPPPGEPAGLVLEGSGIWPDRVAGLPPDRVGAAWLVADPAVLRRRVLAQSGFGEPSTDMTSTDMTSTDMTSTDMTSADMTSAAGRAAVLAFLGRTLRFQALLVAALHELDRPAVDVSDDPPVELLAARLCRLVVPGRLSGEPGSSRDRGR